MELYYKRTQSKNTIVREDAYTYHGEWDLHGDDILCSNKTHI